MTAMGEGRGERREGMQAGGAEEVAGAVWASGGHEGQGGASEGASGTWAVSREPTEEAEGRIRPGGGSEVGSLRRAGEAKALSVNGKWKVTEANDSKGNRAVGHTSDGMTG